MSTRQDDVRPHSLFDSPQDRIERRKENRHIGEPISRVDGPLKVTGRARFAAEVPAKDLTYGSVCYSSIARGRIKSIDTSAAAAASGVLLVLTHENAPSLAAQTLFPLGAAGSSLPVLQDPDIHWNGQPVALVIATTQEQADYAAALIRVTYDARTAATNFHEARDKAKYPDK